MRLQSNRERYLHSKGALPHASSHRVYCVCDCCAVDDLQAQIPELERLAKLAKPKLLKLVRRQTIACSSSSSSDEVPPARVSLDASEQLHRQAKPPVARKRVAAKASGTKRKAAVDPWDTDLGRRISADGSRVRGRPAVDRRSTPGHSADVAIELDDSGVEESQGDSSPEGESGDGEGSEGETSGGESDEGESERRDAGADPHGFVLGGPSEGRKRPRQPRQQSLVGWFARARRRTRPVAGSPGEPPVAHEQAVDADERPAQGFFMRRPRTHAPPVHAPHGRLQPMPHAADASRSRAAADAADAAEDERSAPHAAILPRPRSLPRRGWRGFEAFVLPRMETVAAADQQAAAPAPAAPAASAAPAPVQRASWAASVPARAPAARTGRSKRKRNLPRSTAQRVNDSAGRPAPAADPLCFLSKEPPRLLPLATGARVASLEPILDGATRPSAKSTERSLQPGKQLCERLPSLFALCNSRLALLQVLHQLGREAMAAEGASLRAAAAYLASFLPRLHSAIAATVSALGEERLKPADVGILADALANELALLRTQGPIWSLLPSNCEGDGAGDALSRGHLQLRWVCLHWLRRLSAREDSAERCAPLLANQARAVASECLPLAGDTPNHHGVRAPLPRVALSAEPDALADRPVMALWHELRLALDGAKPVNAHASGPGEEGMTPFWGLLSELLGDAANTLATPYGRLPATALQKLGWQWRCLAYLAPLYGLNEDLVVVHPGSWPHGCWPLVRQMLESSRLHPEGALGSTAADADQADKASQLLLRLCCELTARWPPNAGLAHVVWQWQWQSAPAWRCCVLHEDAALPDLAAWCSAEAQGRALEQAPGDNCCLLALRFLAEQLRTASPLKRGAGLSKLMAWMEGKINAQREAAACVVTSCLDPAQAGNEGKRATPWQIVVSLLLWVELRCAAPAAQEQHKERVLTKASDWLNMLSVRTVTTMAHRRMVVTTQARLVNIAQDAAVSTSRLSSGLNDMVYTLARAQVDGAESGDEGCRVLLFALERCAALLWRRSASSSPGGETALLGSGLALLVRRGSPELCSSALHVLEAALDAACPTSVERPAGVVRWCETLCTALSDIPWWQGERSPMQERLEATRLAADAPAALNLELFECWARAEALLLRSANRPTELLRSRLSVLSHKHHGQPSEDATLSSDAQLQAILLRQRRRAVPCTFLASFLRHCAGSPGRSDALVSSLWACYGEDIEQLWFCAMVDPAVHPVRQQDLSSQLRALGSSLPDAAVAQSALLPALQALPAADFAFRDSFTVSNRTAVLLRVLGSLATMLPPVKLGGNKAKLERAERSLRPAVSLLTRRLEEAEKLDSLHSRGAAVHVSAETPASAQLAYRVARELWGLPHVLKCNGGHMVTPLVDKLLLRAAPTGCEPALMELLPTALAGMCEAGSDMQVYMQRKICEVVLRFRERPGSRAAISSVADNPRLKCELVRGLVLPRLQPHDPASKSTQDHIHTVLDALLELRRLMQATPNARAPVGPVAVPSATDHLKAAELVLPYLLRLAVLTGLQTAAECKLSIDLQHALLKLLGASPAGISLLEQLETQHSSLVTADLVLEVRSSLGANP